MEKLLHGEEHEHLTGKLSWENTLLWLKTNGAGEGTGEGDEAATDRESVAPTFPYALLYPEIPENIPRNETDITDTINKTDNTATNTTTTLSTSHTADMPDIPDVPVEDITHWPRHMVADAVDKGDIIIISSSYHYYHHHIIIMIIITTTTITTTIT